MSLLKKITYCDDIFKKESKQTPQSGASPAAAAPADGCDAAAGSEVPRRTLDHFGAKTLTRKEVEEWAESKAVELSMLRDWLRKQPHLPGSLTDEQLLVFLHSCDGSVEKTKTKVDNHFTMRTHLPEIFRSRSIESREVAQAFRVARISPLRKATPSGSNAIFVDCVDPNVENYNFTHVLKATGMAIDALIRYYPREETNIMVFDMRNSVLAHVLKTNVVTLKKAMLFVQSSLPFKLSQIHVINAFPLIHQIQTMIKPFIDGELSKLIHIHMMDNMETFYKFVPQKCLPREYGGEAPSLRDLNDALKEMIKEQESYLEAVEGQVVDESKRAGRAKSSSDVFGVEGSFRRLDFD